MQVEVIMPKMGESIQEGKILRWAKKVGDRIDKDEILLEISTDKVDSDIPSPVAGILATILVQETETVPIGTILAKIETENLIHSDNVIVHPSFSSQDQKKEPTIPSLSKINVSTEEQAVEDDRFYSPLVKMIARREGVTRSELRQLAGSGVNGRVTKNDVLSYLEKRSNQKNILQAAEQHYEIRNVDLTALMKKYPAPKYRVIQMNNLQQTMAAHMARSVATSPHVTALDEVDVTAIVSYRVKESDRFEKQEGFKLTYTPFFADAAITTLKEFPIINSSIEGNAIIYKNFINLGIAVAAPAGLMVPVVRNAGEKKFTDLARAMYDIAIRTRDKKLMPDEVQDGTFSLTNYGVFGNISGTPIINQPQVAILGIGAIKRRPIVITGNKGNESIAIRSMVYLTLSFDHRIIDGAIGGQFLSRMKWHLENFNFQEVR